MPFGIPMCCSMYRTNNYETYDYFFKVDTFAH